MAGLGYLCGFLLGGWGLSLAAIGFCSFAPIYLSIANYYMMADNCSFISFVNKNDDMITEVLVDLAKTRKEYEPHLNIYFTGFIALLGYAFVIEFIERSEISASISMNSATIFAGLIIGAMLPYFLSFNMISSVQQVAPVIPYDLELQVDDVPAMADGKVEP